MSTPICTDAFLANMRKQGELVKQEYENTLKARVEEIVESLKDEHGEVPDDCSSNFCLGPWDDPTAQWFKMSMRLCFRTRKTLERMGLPEITNMEIIGYLCGDDDLVFTRIGNTIHIWEI